MNFPHLPSFRRITPLFALLLAIGACATAELKPAPPTSPEDDGAVVTPEDGGSPGADAEPETTADGAPAPEIAASHDVRIFIQPSDNAAALLAAIRGAKKSIHMTMYMLTSNAITQALIDQKRAGRDVKVVLNQNFPQGGNANESDANKLKAAGVAFAWAPPAFPFTHSKCILLDGAEAWIMTMNATETSARDNREYLAVDRDPADVAQAEAIFQGDFTNTASNAAGTLVVSPVSASKRLLALIDSARSSLEIEAESLSDDGIVTALVAAFDRGVKVRVVLSTDFTSTGEQEAISKLKAKKIPLVSLDAPYVHAKAIAVDGKRAYVGSINFTPTSISRNREIGVITDAAAEVAKVVSTISGDFGKGTAL